MKSKFLLRLGILSTVLVLLSGCEFLDNLRAKILGQIDTTTSRVTQKAKEIQEQAEKTRAAVSQKVQDVQNAVREVGEAVDAVKKVTDGTTTEEKKSTEAPNLK